MLVDARTHLGWRARKKNTKYKGKYKYKITYNSGRWSDTEYTDTFQVNPGPSIKYINEFGKEITRYGTYSIQSIK